jgi:hypothetical protein
LAGLNPERAEDGSGDADEDWCQSEKRGFHSRTLIGV